MTDLVRTTVNIPRDMLVWAKINAARNRVSVSDLVREGIKNLREDQRKLSEIRRIKPGSGLKSVMGSLKLGGKEPYKKRTDLYEEHLRRKFSG